MLGLVLALLGTTVLAAPAPAPPVLLARQDASTEPCAALIVDGGGGTAYTPGMVRACLQSTPFSEEARKSIMASVTAMNTLNVFEYNELGNEDPMIDQGVDLESEFKRISSADYTSDWDFQTDLTKVVNSLNDGHYAWQSCYSQLFTTSHVLPIVSLMDGDDTAIFLAPNLPLYATANGLAEQYKSLGYDLTELAGLKVTKIEGQAPYAYLDDVAGPIYGGYQDKEQRLNAQFASYTSKLGAFTLQLGGFAQSRVLPEKNNVTLTVQMKDGQEKDISSPWLTTYNGRQPWSFKTGQELYNGLCVPQSSGADIESETSVNGPDGTSEDPDSNFQFSIREAYGRCPSNYTAGRYPYENSPQNSTAYLGGRDIQFYALGDEQKTGVIYVSTLDPKDVTGQSTSACTMRYTVDVYLGFRNLTKAGVERIMIDTSNNGGGSVELNQYLQRYLTGDDYEVDLNFNTLLRDSPLARALLEANIKAAGSGAYLGNNIYSPGKYRNGTSMVAVDDDIFTPGKDYTINNKTLSTSDVLQDNVKQVDFLEGFLNISDTPPYKPAQIVFIGNGLCGSACASFTNFLIEYQNATGYITSGRPKNPIAFQAFAAGQSTNSGLIYQEAAAVGMNDTSLLPTIDVVGQLGFTVRGALSPNVAPGKFLQYRPYPAKGSYGLTAEQFLDPLENWKYVATKAFA